MTAKRFTLEEFGLNFIVNDNGRNLTAKQTVDRLNELYEKDRDGEECYRKLLEKYDKLKEENEQLKSFIKKLQNSNGQIVLMNGYGYTKSYIDKLFNEKELEE